jgi:uncharacterized RDD family membrane protein YckC
MSITNTKTPAGLGLRILAFVLDCVLVGAIAYYLAMFLEIMLVREYSTIFKYGAFADAIEVFPVYIAVYLAYHWVGEQSIWQGSPIKRLMGIKVVRKDGSKSIHFLQVWGRILGKLIWLVLPPIFFGLFTDWLNLAEFIAVILTLVAWLILFILWGNEKEKRTFYDFFTKTEVIHR